jgi:hypothetical protein
VVYREDAFFGPMVAHSRAKILAQAGEAEAALDEIERLLAGPSGTSASTRCGRTRGGIPSATIRASRRCSLSTKTEWGVSGRLADGASTGRHRSASNSH